MANEQQSTISRPGSRRRSALAVAAVVALTIGAAVGLSSPAGASGGADPLSPVTSLLGNVVHTITGSLLDFGCANDANHTSTRLLPAAPAAVGHATCFGSVVSPKGIGPSASSGPVGLTPANIQSAYKLTGLKAAGRTVGIVDAYDDPNAEADLAVFRSQYGLPACTTANGCFRKVNQAGATSPLPGADAGWSEEISLDLDAVSSACPSCHILLVEASNTDLSSLLASVNTAVRLGASAVSNSYGGSEDRSQLSADASFNHPGVSITAASGDSGYGAQWPASSPYVTAVGGTTLAAAGNTRGWTETAWSDAGSGCSAYEAKPSWQKDTGCGKRTVADVSADADPTTGLGIYDTYNTCAAAALCSILLSFGAAQGLDGWAQVGGTSLAAPLIASVYALAGNGASASYLYSHRGALFDVTSGSNGSCGSYLCNAGVGYDGPTGLGTPDGIGAF